MRSFLSKEWELDKNKRANHQICSFIFFQFPFFLVFLDAEREAILDFLIAGRFRGLFNCKFVRTGSSSANNPIQAVTNRVGSDNRY